MVFATLFLAAGCDKIDDEARLIFAGQTGSWYDGNGVSDHTQRALLEKYTGPRCNNCPTADDVIRAAVAQYDGRLVTISIHDYSSFGTPIGNVDLRTEDGDTWSKYFGIEQYPAALINRSRSNGTWSILTPTGSVDADIDAALAATPALALDLTASAEGRQVTIEVDIEFLQSISDELTLTLVAIEDGIHATQILPNYEYDDNYTHNHILRDVITDIWGADIDADGKAGTKRHAVFEYEMSERWNMEQCHIVAFVSNKNSRSILNVNECEIE